MSIVRHGKDSDVYIFEHVDGFVSCCMCKLTEPGGAKLVGDSLPFRELWPFLQHVAEHRAAGHKVPEYVEGEIVKAFLRTMFEEGFRHGMDREIAHVEQIQRAGEPPEPPSETQALILRGMGKCRDQWLDYAEAALAKRKEPG